MNVREGQDLRGAFVVSYGLFESEKEERSVARNSGPVHGFQRIAAGESDLSEVVRELGGPCQLPMNLFEGSSDPAMELDRSPRAEVAVQRFTHHLVGEATAATQDRREKPRAGGFLDQLQDVLVAHPRRFGNDVNVEFSPRNRRYLEHRNTFRGQFSDSDPSGVLRSAHGTDPSSEVWLRPRNVSSAVRRMLSVSSDLGDHAGQAATSRSAVGRCSPRHAFPTFSDRRTTFLHQTFAGHVRRFRVSEQWSLFDIDRATDCPPSACLGTPVNLYVPINS